MTDLDRALTTARSAARAAAQVHRQYAGTISSEEWTEKGSADFATHVDYEAERRVVELIRDAFPHHDILAEEATGSQSSAARNSEYMWVADPLDGTTNFLHQYPMYSASVALLRDDEPVVGAVICSPTGEEWTAQQGKGAFRNGKPIQVSRISRFERALIGTGFPFKVPALRDRYLEQFRAVLSYVSDARRSGSAALDLCHVATGHFDGFWELDLRPWDFAAGILMIREAGGVVSALDGDIDWLRGNALVAGNPDIYPILRDVVLSAREKELSA